MQRSQWLKTTGLLLVAGVCAGPGAAHALTAAELRGLLERREAVTVLDVRSAGAYAQGHLPGALSLPVEIVAQRRLPPLGRVVVVGDGVRGDEERRAVLDLNAKPGIRAELLEGGFPAWEGDGGASTRSGGLEVEQLRFLSYQELQAIAAGARDLVLVDLRSGESPRTELASRFPEAIQWRPELAGSGSPEGMDLAPLLAISRPAKKLLVLLDNGAGDDTAEAVARRLKAAGVGRVAMLAGGEASLSRAGRTGFGSVETGSAQ
ncbi:MAG: rhodanese-like domain-containing protein [Deferrisomatales bacterium]|nr:rhodanese-like domain-containing protein [Deferrisomatales bacterium]